MTAGVVNVTQVDATVACAGDTPRKAFATIAAAGFTSVVHLRMDHQRGMPVEPAQGRAMGLTSTVIIEFVERFLDPRG
jgi:hypothetical protein